VLDKLFSSKVRAEVLGLFFKEPNKKYYIQEIARLISGDPANIFRELKKLEKIGLLVSNKEGAVKYYQTNTNAPLFDALTKLVVDADKAETSEWFLIEEIPGYTPSTIYYPMSANFVNKHYRSVGFDLECTQILCLWDKGLCSMWILRKEFDRIVDRLLEIMTKDPNWMKKYLSKLDTQMSEFRPEIEKLDKMNLAKLSNEELWSIYDEYQLKFGLIGVCAWIQAGVDYGDSILSKHLLRLIEEKAKEKGIQNLSVGETFATLTTPLQTSMITREHEDLKNIITIIREKPELSRYFQDSETRLIIKDLPTIDPEVNKMIEKHATSFGWIGYGILGPSWGKDYFVDLISSLLRQNMVNDPDEAEAKITAAEKLQKLEKMLELNDEEKGIFALSRDLVSTKSARKDLTFYFYSVIENVFREIGRRHYLSLNQVRYMYPEEVKKALLSGEFDVDRINMRTVRSVRLSESGVKKDRLLEGELAEEYVRTLDLDIADATDVKMLLGDCACPGRVKGVVRIVNTASEMSKVLEGDILVSLVTNPDIVPAMKKAGAIVTDTGGITCHAAIVSRELNIPCVIGTKIATRALKDGDLVDVDATHGKITIITKA
jgi:phosphohistidine swiveling domain-containing protein/predicted transcriptional regulator with HTH domain